MVELTPDIRVQQVLSSLGRALEAADMDQAVALFQNDCYRRDLVAFTWNIKTMEGKPAIRAMLDAQLATS